MFGGGGRNWVSVAPCSSPTFYSGVHPGVIIILVASADVFFFFFLCNLFRNSLIESSLFFSTQFEEVQMKSKRLLCPLFLVPSCNVLKGQRAVTSSCYVSAETYRSFSSSHLSCRFNLNVRSASFIMKSKSHSIVFSNYDLVSDSVLAREGQSPV